MSNEVDPRRCRQLLDACLLYGTVGDDSVQECLDGIGRSRYRGHLIHTGLANGAPEAERARFEALLRLRGLFCDVPRLSERLIDNVYAVARLRGVLSRYVYGDSELATVRSFVSSLREDNVSEETLLMVQELAYAISMAEAPAADPHRIQPDELVDVCLRTIRQSEDYWHGIMGR